MKKSILSTPLWIATCMSSFGAPPAPFGVEWPKPSAEEALDHQLADELIAALKANNREEFLALVAVVRLGNQTRKGYVDVMFRAAAHPDRLFLLALLKSGIVNINDEIEDGHSIGPWALKVPEPDEFPHRLRRLQLLLDLGYKAREAELLVQAAVENCPEVINELDERAGGKLDVNVPFSGTTPLIAAVKYGSVQCVSMLLARKADLHAKDSEGKTAIDHSARDLPIKSKARDFEDIRAEQLAIRQLIKDALAKQN